MATIVNLPPQQENLAGQMLLKGLQKGEQEAEVKQFKAAWDSYMTEMSTLLQEGKYDEAQKLQPPPEVAAAVQSPEDYMNLRIQRDKVFDRYGAPVMHVDDKGQHRMMTTQMAEKLNAENNDTWRTIEQRSQDIRDKQYQSETLRNESIAALNDEKRQHPEKFQTKYPTFNSGIEQIPSANSIGMQAKDFWNLVDQGQQRGLPVNMQILQKSPEALRRFQSANNRYDEVLAVATKATENMGMLQQREQQALVNGFMRKNLNIIADPSQPLDTLKEEAANLESEALNLNPPPSPKPAGQSGTGLQNRNEGQPGILDRVTGALGLGDQPTTNKATGRQGVTTGQASTDGDMSSVIGEVAKTGKYNGTPATATNKPKGTLYLGPDPTTGSPRLVPEVKRDSNGYIANGPEMLQTLIEQYGMSQAEASDLLLKKLQE